MGELMAVLDLLKQTRGVENLEILCDSQYVINSVTKWMPGWKKKGWRKADGKPVLNVELIKELDRELAGRTVKFTWVKGHAGHPLNEAADRKANAAAQGYARGKGAPAGPGFTSGPGAAAGPHRSEAPESHSAPTAQAPATARKESAAVPKAAGHKATAASRREPSEAQGTLLSWDDDVALWSSHEELSDHEQVWALEKSLLQPSVRQDPVEVAYLLHPDFQEIGSSGRLWDRPQIMAALAGDDAGEAPAVDVITARDLGPNLIQLVYRATGKDRAVLRTSLWQRSGSRWQMIWHQGTEERAG